jgi:hypothetical protein
VHKRKIADLRVSDTLILRTPLLSYETYQKTDLANCLEHMLFIQAIRVASKDLYSELERKGFDFQRLAIKTKSSLKKYWNRMHFRPTPFGLFAAFSVVHW